MQLIVLEKMKGGVAMAGFLVEEEHVHDPIDQIEVVAIEVHELLLISTYTQSQLNIQQHPLYFNQHCLFQLLQQGPYS